MGRDIAIATEVHTADVSSDWMQLGYDYFQDFQDLKLRPWGIQRMHISFSCS